jgi:hypothetical protein
MKVALRATYKTCPSSIGPLESVTTNHLLDGKIKKSLSLRIVLEWCKRRQRMAGEAPEGGACSSGRYSGEVWDCLCHGR